MPLHESMHPPQIMAAQDNTPLKGPYNDFSALDRFLKLGRDLENEAGLRKC